MQRVSSVKISQLQRGSRRTYDATGKTVLALELQNASISRLQSSIDHAADMSFTETTINAGSRSERTSFISIGRMAYVRTERLNATPGNTPTVMPQGLWRPNLNAEPFLFPYLSFGKFGDGAQKSAEVPAVVPALDEGERGKLKLTARGSLVDNDQALLRGKYEEELTIAADTRLWSRWARTRTYEDGATYSEAQEFTDYNVPNAVERPRTNTVSRFVPGPEPASTQLGTLVLRICAQIELAPYRPTVCESSRPLSGISVKLVRYTAAQEPVAQGTTDANGTVTFPDLAVYLDYGINLACGPSGGKGVAMSAGAVNAGGTTYLDIAVC